jgi:hypothetical protein
LQAISIFISASAKYLEEFMEVGGVATIIEILSLEINEEAEKQETLSVLDHIMEGGSACKEMICHYEGYEVIVECMQNSTDAQTLGIKFLKCM